MPAYPNTVPPGGTADQALAKIDSVDYHVYWRDILIPVDASLISDIPSDIVQSSAVDVPNQITSSTTIVGIP